MKVLIVDDHAVVRLGLERLLALEFPNSTFSSASHPQEALDLAFREAWDIVILDLEIPGRGGLEILEQIKSKCPKLPVVIYTIHSEEHFAIRCLKAGASGFISKTSDLEELLRAVEHAGKGRRYINPELGEILAAHYAEDPSATPIENLSNREFQVFRMLARGMGTTDIANELSLSVKTISTYKTRLLAKLGLHNLSDLIRFAIEQGIETLRWTGPSMHLEFRDEREPPSTSVPLESA